MALFTRPHPGDNVALICSKCKNSFSGKYPGFSFSILKNIKTKCPKCGCSKVELNPFVNY